MQSRSPTLIMIVGLLAVCSCGIVSQPNTSTSPGNHSVVSPSGAASTPILTRLHCTTYVETQWGTGPGEFGLCPSTLDVNVQGPYPPRFNEKGDMFVVDRANRRILRYSANTLLQAIPIPSTYMLDSECGYLSGWVNVSASTDKLFFRFTQSTDDGRLVDRLAVLSVEGEEQHIIDLEPYYPLHTTCLNALVADGLGGIYVILPPVGAVHFDANYRPTFMCLGCDAPFFCDDLALGWDGNLYTYSHERDAVDNWRTRHPGSMEDAIWISDAMAAAQIDSPSGTRLLGADTLGRLYVSTFECGREAMVIRFTVVGGQIAIATVPAEWPLPNSLAPDGSLYGVSYDPEDPSVRPKIFKCVFDQDLIP